jgi:hypothetical protein
MLIARCNHVDKFFAWPQSPLNTLAAPPRVVKLLADQARIEILTMKVAAARREHIAMPYRHPWNNHVILRTDFQLDDLSSTMIGSGRSFENDRISDCAGVSWRRIDSSFEEL